MAYRSSFLLRLTLILGASTMLSSCDFLPRTQNPFSPASSRPDQTVEGERHAPLLNEQYLEPHPGQPAPSMMAPASPPPSPPPAMPAAPAPRTSIDANPYDYYDASGNVVQPTQKNDGDSSSQGNFFSRLFSGIHLGSSQPENGRGENGLRKPLPENPYSPDENASDEPASSGMATSPLLPPGDTGQSPAAQKPPLPWTSGNAAPAPDAGPAPAADPNYRETTIVAPPSSDARPAESSSSMPSWLSGIFGGSKDDAEAKTADRMATPPLSSVPAVPPEFQAIRADRQQNTQELQNDHTAALQTKQDLDSEPSGQQTVTPVDMPPADKKAENPPPAADTAPAVAEATSPLQPMPQEPVLLGHASAPLNPADSNIPDASPTLSVPPILHATPAAMAENAQQQTAPGEQPGATPPHSLLPVMASPPATVNVPPPVADDAAAGKKQKKAQDASDGQEAPADNAATAQPLLPPAQEMPATAPSAGGDALPSPQLLQNTRVLPPSRYEDRDQATQPASDY